MNVAPLAPIRPIDTGDAKPHKAELGESFQKALDEAQHAEKASVDASERFAHGDPSIGIHETVIAAEKASISLRFATTLKNKALEAYRELMSTQV